MKHFLLLSAYCQYQFIIINRTFLNSENIVFDVKLRSVLFGISVVIRCLHIYMSCRYYLIYQSNYQLLTYIFSIFFVFCILVVHKLITYPIMISLIMEQFIEITDTAFLGRVGEIELGVLAIAGVYYHSILPYFISSPLSSYCLRLPVGGADKVIRTTAVR